MRVILDTNVLLSGLLVAQRIPARLLDAWEQGRFTLVACEEIVAELHEVAARPFFKARLRASAVELLASGLRDFSVFIEDLASGATAPDPKDSFLLALAEASAADYLVTGDKKLQSLKRHRATGIVSPAAMSRIIEELENERGE